MKAVQSSKFIVWCAVDCTFNSISDYTLCTLHRSYFNRISANIELQVYSVTCCWPYIFHLILYITGQIPQSYQRVSCVVRIYSGVPIDNEKWSLLYIVFFLYSPFNIHGRKGEVLSFGSVPRLKLKRRQKDLHHTWDGIRSDGDGLTTCLSAVFSIAKSF
jgi:hypothetical protein